MPEAFEQCHIIQPQHLSDIHVLGQNRQFMCHIFEEKVALPKNRWVEKLKALQLSSLSAELRLNNNRQIQVLCYIFLEQEDIKGQPVMKESISSLCVKLGKHKGKKHLHG